jgi:hypothetical protein
LLVVIQASALQFLVGPRYPSLPEAAEACADTGNFNKGIEIALDVEQLLYEVNTFLNAASLIHRLSKSQ